MARKAIGLKITGGADALAAAAIAAAIALSLTDEEELASKPKEPRTLSEWRSKAGEPQTYIQPIPPPQP